MLRGIDPLLGPELLQILRSMGHGDEIAIVDANYPAASGGRPLVRLDGVTATQTLEAVLSVMPLDTYVDCAAHCMEVVGEPQRVEPIMDEFQAFIDRIALEEVRIGRIERFAFYDRVKSAFAVVVTAESRLYGNIILTKGIIKPNEEIK